MINDTIDDDFGILFFSKNTEVTLKITIERGVLHLIYMWATLLGTKRSISCYLCFKFCVTNTSLKLALPLKLSLSNRKSVTQQFTVTGRTRRL